MQRLTRGLSRPNHPAEIRGDSHPRDPKGPQELKHKGSEYWLERKLAVVAGPLVKRCDLKQEAFMPLPLDLKHVRRRADRALDEALTAVAWLVATCLLLGYALGAMP